MDVWPRALAVTVTAAWLQGAGWGCSKKADPGLAKPAPGPSRRTWVAGPEFRIAFPDAPGPSEHTLQSAAWGKVDVTTWRLRRPSGVSCQVQRMAADAPLNEQGDVDGAMKGLAAQAHETPVLLGDRRVAIGDCAGREFSARVTGLTLRSLLCVRGEHAYLAQAAMPSSVTVDEQAEADAFLASFAVAPPADR